MTTPAHSWFMRWAEVVDSWRFVPRCIIFGACYYVYHFTDVLITWYIHEPATARGLEESGALVGIIGSITAVLTMAFKFYMDNGRTWDPTPKQDNQPPA